MWIFLTAVFLVMVWLLYKFPRRTLKIGSLIIGAVLTIGGIALYMDHLESERWRQDQQAVKITLKYDEADCPKSHPLRVIIRNGSRRTISTVRWDVGIYRPGYSTNLVDSLSDDVSSDFILAPAKAATACYPIPKLNRTIDDASKLQYRASNHYVSFSEAKPDKPGPWLKYQNDSAANDPLGIR